MYELNKNKRLQELLEEVLRLPILKKVTMYGINPGIYEATSDKEIPIIEIKKATKLEQYLTKQDVVLFVDNNIINKASDKTIMAYITHELLSVDATQKKTGETIVNIRDRSHKLYEQVYDYFGDSAENIQKMVEITRRPSKNIIKETKRRPRSMSEIDILA